MKNRRKRVVSALLVIALLVTFLPVIPKENVLSYAADVSKVTRGVVERIEQLPQYQNENYLSLKKGTEKRPLLVLEIVPYEEMAELGYQIGGCEPVAVEQMYGRGEITTVGSLADAVVTKQTAYFFSDEPEGDEQNYDVVNGKCNLRACEEEKTLDGYYEVVKDGEGTFTWERTEEQIQFKPKRNGNLIWHTVNEFEKDDYSGILFDGDLSQHLVNPGDRFYTKRTASLKDSDQKLMITENYYTYESKEHFLKDTLQLSDEEAAAYSVVIKTITPEELNENIKNQNNWVQYADLISISPKSHDASLISIWQEYKRLGKDDKSITDTGSLTGNCFRNGKDISWEAALQIFKRVTEKKNYAALIMDDGIYNTPLQECQKNSLKIKVFDWNMKDTGFTQETTGYNNNTYKLAVMLFSMRSSLFRELYVDGDNPVIQDGKDKRQEGAAADYWSFYTFLPVPAEKDRPVNFEQYAYWSGAEAWQNYNMTPTPSNEGYKNWTLEHVYSYKGDNGLLRGEYIIQKLANVDKFDEFQDYIEGKQITDPNPSDAVRFILGIEDSPEPQEQTLRVLDLDPCVDLQKMKDKNGKEEEDRYEPKWTLQESYVRMLLPGYTGEIEITHQTTAEFNGKAEDLNSTYDLIYLGMDDGAYHKAAKTVSLKNVSGNQQQTTIMLPDWNDNSMDGKIYSHTGDMIESPEIQVDGKDRSVQFLWDKEKNKKVESTELRFAGNDISSLKKAELEEFAKAGYPIVAAGYLYQLPKSLVDNTSNIWKFVEEYQKDKGVYSTTQTEQILKAVRKGLAEDVVFTELPVLYDGTTKDETSAEFKTESYLPQSGGRSYLQFVFQVNQPGYSYRLYMDANRNGKFEDDEVLQEKTAKEGENICRYRLPASLVGLLQWKLEVYQTDCPQVRYVKTGCSAAKGQEKDKKKIQVLQIMPKPDNKYSGKLDLKNDRFQKYYKDLVDYEISIDTTTWSEFRNCFSGSGFHFDSSKEIADSNPVNENNIKYLNGLNKKPADYNMIIVGFGDAYGATDLSGIAAVEYLEYFAAQGKSILFTHDVMSMYNETAKYLDFNSSDKIFGSTANAMLRDLMGMNRYEMVSNQLPKTQRDSLIAYQNLTENDHYDTISSSAKHGFTYYALKRLGWNNKNINIDRKVPYRYMVQNPKGAYICNKTYFTQKTGFNNNNDLTTTASKLNDGEITEYPYKISDTLPISDTHGQWYQLNVEDPEVTVWYCLSDDHKYSAWDGKDSNGTGTAVTYGVSPNDAANNYYIYSKGNIFYSGVGHSTDEKGNLTEMETKLFVNTMIAAYRASYEAPVIEITNEEAELVEKQSYSMSVTQEYNGMDGISIEKDAAPVKVTFTPVDFNTVKTRMDGWVYRMNGGKKEYIDTIYRVSDDQPIQADENHMFKDLKNGEEYYVYYEPSWLKDSDRMLYFDIKNNKLKDVNTTKLNMTTQPLFYLG